MNEILLNLQLIAVEIHFDVNPEILIIYQSSGPEITLGIIFIPVHFYTYS